MKQYSHKHLQIITLLALVFWLGMVGLSWAWNHSQAHLAREQVALATARAFVGQVILMRRWNAMHEGIYAPVSEHTPPNPYLSDIDNRDLYISDALMLTKINPAYMTRQISELAQTTQGLQFRITSLDPIRPANVALPWEKEALLAFANGAQEQGGFFTYQGRQRFRYMTPLVTEPSCLVCHGQQGYEVGAIRGGISVTLNELPPLPVYALLISHTAIAGLGALFILLMHTFLIRTYRRLQQSETKLASILHHMSDAMWSARWPDLHTLFVTPSTAKVYGYPLTVFTDNHRVRPEMVHPEDRLVLKKLFDQLLKQGYTQGEYRIKRADDSIAWLWEEYQLIRDDSGKIVRLDVHASDITKYKQAEAELRQLNLSLQQANDKAHQLTLAANQANAAKSEFLANMSHEIRTPMNGVIGMTGLLLDTKLDSQQRYYAESVLSSAESLLSLINDILDFSKIEAGKLELESIDFNLLNLLDDFASTLAWKAHQKGLELICAADVQTPVQLRGDPGRLRQILNNFGSNAVKFTHEGEVVVRADTVWENATQTMLRFTIKDTGIGIAPEKHAKLFTSFTQLDSSTTREYGGTGLGLVICKRLTELMQGELGFDSIPGQGSTFWFTVRLDKSRQQTGPTMPIDTHLEGIRVLIVDDHPTNCEILSALLKSWGMRPEQSANGQSGLMQLQHAAANGDPFGIALIDLEMPVMDGDTLGRAIQADTTLSNLRCVILPSLLHKGDLQHYAANGFHAYLPKPVRQQDLHNVLRTVLDDATVQSQAIITSHSSKERLQDHRNKFLQGELRLLLVEDDPINQAVALGALKRLGLLADVANDGEQALQALAITRYDLVFMDVQMPILDGLQTTRKIRNREHGVLHPEVPIIAMTANAMCGDREKCLASGMNDYIPKPLPVDAIQDMLKRWLPQMQPAALMTQSQQTPIEALQGFDTVAAIARMGGDLQAYCAVLRKFAKHHKDTAKALTELVHAGNIQLATTLAHSIKGVAANIGAIELNTIAAQLEQQLEAQTLQHLPKLLQVFEQILTQTLDCIEPLTQESCCIPQNPALSSTELLAQLKGLSSRLSQYDTESINDVHALLAKIPPSEVREQLERLQMLLEHYDFDTAQDMLSTLCTSLRANS